MIEERRTEVETGNGTGQEQHIAAFLPVPMELVPNLEETSETLPSENVLRQSTTQTSQKRLAFRRS
jgi:hypothetical protein